MTGPGWQHLGSGMRNVSVPFNAAGAYFIKISRWFTNLFRDELRHQVTLEAGKVEAELHKLFNLCEENAEIRRLLRRYDTRRTDLFTMYSLLKTHGANITVKDRYVAASALINPSTLRFLLLYYRNRRFEVKHLDDADSAKVIVAYLLHYYEKGDTEGLLTG